MISFLFWGVSQAEVRAEEEPSIPKTEENQLTIQKYQLTEQQLNSLELPIGSPLDPKLLGENPIALEGVGYKIEKVRPSNNDKTPFEPEPGIKPLFVKTDISGKATLSLEEGIYQVSEQSDPRLSGVAKPVIVSLPYVKSDGSQLTDVWLYPKSGVVTPTNPPGKSPSPGGSSSHGDSSNPQSNTHQKIPDRPTKIPQTSGNIGSVKFLYVLLGVVVGIGTLSILFLNPPKNEIKK